MTTNPPESGRGLFGRRPQRGITETAKAVAADANALVRAEIALAKAEILAGVKTKARGAGLLVAAGVLAGIAGLGILLAIGFALAEVAGLPGWAAALVVSAALAAVAVALAVVGRSSLSTAIRYDTTRRSLEEDLEWTKAHLRGR